MREVVIVSGARTAIGTFGASLKEVSAIQLGAIAIREALKRVGLSRLLRKNFLRSLPTRSNGQA